MKNTPVYDKTVSYAREHNELEAFRTSKRENIACKNAVADAIRRNYDGSHINTKQALNELKEGFSLERIAVVTAVTIRPRDWDARISQENKEWAKSFPFPAGFDSWGYDRNSEFIVSEIHPGLMNLFANAVRKELDLEKAAPAKKSSLVEKLNRPLPPKSDKADKSKEQEL